MILGHMVMDENGANAKQGQQAWGQGRGRQTRPAQAVVAKTGRQVKLAGLSSRSGGSWRECGGAGHLEGGLGPTLLSPSKPIAFASLCPYPLP